MTLSIMREYEPHELGRDGYPRVWHRGIAFDTYEGTGEAAAIALYVPDSEVGVKDLVRAEAGNRCIRCLHPYRQGEFAWEDPEKMSGPRPGLPDEVLAGMMPYAQKVDPGAGANGRAVHWSPCDAFCRHGAPVRVLRNQSEPGPGDAPGWAYSWPTMAREALNVDDTHNAGALVVDGKTVEAAWRILTVHHLNGRKHDLRWWNLVSLCQRCHLLIQKTVILERVWPWEHDEWFKPYAAGWYAYSYLGEHLTRDETLVRLDELLALERMA